MAMNPLPPQAYTKETLTKAYNWLLLQSPAIREMAATPDILVSLYLKAQRSGDEALDRPSIQNFKNELKNLAGMMGEFEGHKAPTPSPMPSATPTPASAPAPAPAPFVAAPITDLLGSLDSKSRQMISEVRGSLNLSNDVEVLRLLISLGYHKAKSLYS